MASLKTTEANSMTLPAFMADAPRLRATLDSLQAALARTGPVETPGLTAATLLYDRQRLAETVRLVLEALERNEPGFRFAPSLIPPEARDPDRFKLFDAIVRDHRGAL